MIRLGRRQLAASAAALGLTLALLAWLLGDPAVRARLGPATADADWSQLAAAVLLLAGVQWLRAWRFGVLTFGATGLPRWRLVRISAQLTALNFLLPFRLGEVSFPLLMKRTYGLALMRGTGVLVAARLLDLAVVGALVAGLAAWLLPADLPGWGRGALALAALGAAATTVVLTAAGRPIARLMAGLPRLGGPAARLAHGFEAMRGPAPAVAVLALSWAIWTVFGLAAWLAAGAVVVPMPPAIAMFGAAAGNLAFALPVNGVIGLGPAQAAWVAATTAAGQAFETAAMGALALHAAAVVSAVGFGGLATAIPAGRAADPAPGQPEGSPSTTQP